MIKAAGACIIAKNTKRILLQHRSLNSSYPRNWSFWGGKIEPNENVSQGLLRELEEEAYLKGNIIFREWEDRVKNEIK